MKLWKSVFHSVLDIWIATFNCMIWAAFHNTAIPGQSFPEKPTHYMEEYGKSTGGFVSITSTIKSENAKNKALINKCIKWVQDTFV